MTMNDRLRAMAKEAWEAWVAKEAGAARETWVAAKAKTQTESEALYHA